MDVYKHVFNCKHLNGFEFVEIITEENEYYYGEVNEDNIPHGNGVKVCKNGHFIEGKWILGKMLIWRL